MDIKVRALGETYNFKVAEKPTLYLYTGAEMTGLLVFYDRLARREIISHDFQLEKPASPIAGIKLPAEKQTQESPLGAPYDDLLRDFVPMVAEQMARAFGPERLVPAMAYESSYLISVGIWRSGSPRGEEVLIAALGNPERDILWAAACGLGEVKARTAVSSLGRLLLDSDYGIRWEAAKALVDIEDPAAIEYFNHMLQACKDEYELESIAQSVASFKDRRAIPIMIGALSRVKNPYGQSVIINFLVQVSGYNAGSDAASWQAWWDRNGEVAPTSQKKEPEVRN